MPTATINWGTEPGTLSGSTAAAADQTHVVKAEFQWKVNGKWASGTKSVTTNKCPKPANPNMTIQKDGPATKYVGDTAVFTIKVTNTGNTILPNPVVTDDKCDTAVVKVTQQSQFDPGDVWEYTCSVKITDAMGAQLVNTACAKVPGKEVCDNHTTKIPKIGIEVVKDAVQSTAEAGTPVDFTIGVKNTGTTSFVTYTFEDTTCNAPGATRTGANAGDANLDPGETWTYACKMNTAVDATKAENCAKATGTNSDGKTATDEDCAEVPLTPPPPVTPPTDTPPTSTPPTSTPDTPSGGVLPETIASGLARLRGPSGYVKTAFRARVSGRSIASVAFFVDGKLVKRINQQRSSYSVKVKPSRYGFGRHRVIARVRFVEGAGTPARRLPLTFRRCAQGAVAPRFTG